MPFWFPALRRALWPCASASFFRLSKINEALARKVQARNEYDKTIQETEAAYMKILESSQTLLHVLKVRCSDSAPIGSRECARELSRVNELQGWLRPRVARRKRHPSHCPPLYRVLARAPVSVQRESVNLTKKKQVSD